ncbi:MAG: DNA primase [Actinomycetota bacterium]
MARINSDDIDALRDRADIVDLIGGYTTLKRSGPNKFKGLCPFHSEKTPSFTVDSSTNLFYCFGCGKGGNIYQFVQEIENLPFPEAVEWLARREGFDLRYEEMKPGEAKAAGMKVRLIAANNEAAAFFHKQLMESPDASAARRYLGSRGFDREVAARWQLGYAPGRDAVCKHLLSKGFTRDELVEADIARVSERNGQLYDSFRERITFPTWNLNGDVVGFGARALLPDQQPKYLNTKETPVFSKSRVMYGLDRAKSHLARGQAVVVEGYTDVIALHEAGVAEAVATNGVALGESHFEQLKKFTDRAVLMFDADDAGKGATERGFGIHHRIGLEVLVAPLPVGRDPADVVKEDGAESIRKVIETAQPLLRFKIEQEISRLPRDTPEARSAAVRAVVQVLGLHPDPISRHEYAFFVAERIGVDPEVVQRALGEFRPGHPGGETGAESRERDRRLPGHVKVEREALQLLLKHRNEVGEWADRITPDDFTAAPRREIFVSVTSGRLDPAQIAQGLSPEALSLFTELSARSEHLDKEDLEERVREVFVRLKIFSLERDIKARRTTLQDVNPVEDPQRHDQLFTELVGLEAERRDLLRQAQGAV